MKKEVRLLLKRAIDSLILSIDHFNRPWDRGRVEAVLILLDHSFEILLKAAILHKGGNIQEKDENQTIGFEKCVNTAQSYKIITEEQAFVLRVINSLRDSVQHYMVDISEQQLYIHAQSGLTLFKDILKDTFKKDVKKELPTRVLPISTTPPLDIDTLYQNEIKEVKKLLNPGSRRRMEAKNKLRGLSIIEKSINGDHLQPNESQLEKLADSVKEGKKWNELFPEVALINYTSEGTKYDVALRFTKKEGIPVHYAPEGTPGAPIIERRVNELGFYNLSHKKLAKKVKLSSPKLTAMVKHLKLKEDPQYCKEFKFGKICHYQYSQEAMKVILKELEESDMEEIWLKNRPEHYNHMSERRKNN